MAHAQAFPAVLCKGSSRQLTWHFSAMVLLSQPGLAARGVLSPPSITTLRSLRTTTTGPSHVSKRYVSPPCAAMPSPGPATDNEQPKQLSAIGRIKVREHQGRLPPDDAAACD